MTHALNRSFQSSRTYKFSDGERFATVVDEAGCPAYLPTAFILSKRAKGVAAQTMKAISQDLVHLGVCGVFLKTDLNKAMSDGKYMSDWEVENLVDLLALKTTVLRQDISRKGRKITRSKDDVVSIAQRNRRISNAADYLDYVGRMSEANISDKRDQFFRERKDARINQLRKLKQLRISVRGSRIKSIPLERELAKVIAFLATGDPSKIWSNFVIRQRNWAFVQLLAVSGVRQSEARQLKNDDIDYRMGEVTIEVRPDDPDDPRIEEPNTKTLGRIIPLPDHVLDLLEEYHQDAQSDVAARTNSPFFFLTHGPSSQGEPISSGTALRVVSQIGLHLGIKKLSPHHLRHAWIQNLANWSIDNGIGDGELVRLANYLGGWSQLSKMATQYRGDQITRQAYEAGLVVGEARE